MIFEAVEGIIPAATIQSRLDAQLGPRTGADRDEVRAWAEVIRPFAVHGKKRGGDDGDAYRLAKADIYCGRLRAILLATGEQRSSWIGRIVATPDEAVTKFVTGGTVADPLMDRLIGGFAANPDLAEDVPLREGVKLDEDGLTARLDDAERYGELKPERAELPKIDAGATLVPLADLTAGDDVDDFDLEQIVPAMARMSFGPGIDVPSDWLDWVRSVRLPALWRAMVPELDTPQTLIAEEPDQDLAHAAKAAIAWIETRDTGTVTWPLVYVGVFSILLMARFFPTVAARFGFDLASLPEPFGQIPWRSINPNLPGPPAGRDS